MIQHPVGTKVIYEFKLAEVLELHEDTGFVRSVRCGPFQSSGRNLTVFPNTKENIEIAKEFETIYDAIYHLPHSGGLNWPVIHGLFVAWSEHVLSGVMTRDKGLENTHRLKTEIAELVGVKSSFGFNLLR